MADAETDVSFSGDRGDVLLDTSGTNQEITLYFQNTGSRTLDKVHSRYLLMVYLLILVGATTLYPTNGVWATEYVIEVTVSDASFSYADNDLATVTIVVQSTVTMESKEQILKQPR